MGRGRGHRVEAFRVKLKVSFNLYHFAIHIKGTFAGNKSLRNRLIVVL